MDKVSLFVDHYVIYSKNREALIVNAGTSSEFEESLRELISEEISSTILKRVKTLNYGIKLAEPDEDESLRYSRLRDASIALMDLYNDLL